MDRNLVYKIYDVAQGALKEMGNTMVDHFEGFSFITISTDLKNIELIDLKKFEVEGTEIDSIHIGDYGLEIWYYIP